MTEFVFHKTPGVLLPAPAARAPDIVVRQLADDARLLTSGKTPVVLADGGPGRRIAVIGDAFTTDGRLLHVEDLYAFAPLETLTSICELIIQRWWGSFVVIAIDDASGPIAICRDPSGGVPCLLYRSERSITAFSRRAFLKRATGTDVDGQVDEEYLVHFLSFPRVANGRTGLKTVRNTVPGTAYVLGNGQITDHPIWTPAQAVRSRADQSAAGPRIRKAVEMSTAAWISRFRLASVSLSGGIDSSIVTGLLAQNHAPQLSVLINCYDRSLTGDERGFARSVAYRADKSLHELLLDGHHMTVEAVAARCGGVSPSNYAIGYLYPQNLYEINATHNADAIFTGYGGDVVFFSDNTHLVVADAFRDKHAGAFGALANKMHNGRTRWSDLFRDTWAYGIRGRPFSFISDRHIDRRLLHGDVHATISLKYILHPWVQDAVGLPAAKMYQIVGLADWLQYYDATEYNEDARFINPLLSHPVVQACLSIPTYILSPGPLDRQLARDTFADYLPPEVYRRKSKGSASAIRTDFLKKHQTEIIERILDGRLRSLGVLDVDRIEQLRGKRMDVSGSSNMGLLTLLSAELWLAGLAPA